MTRVRYSNFNDYVLRSTSSFLIGNTVAKVQLYLNLDKYEIIDLDNGSVIKQGTAGGEQMLKRKAKEALLELGVSFGKEVRIPKPVEGQ